MSIVDGRVALVTGGGRGIGRAIARSLATRGARVVIAARSAEEIETVANEITDDGGMAQAICANVGKKNEIDRLCREIDQSFGPVDILINNAAVVTPLGVFAAISPDEWVDAAEINLLGPVRLTHRVLRHMLASRFGRIVNVSSGVVQAAAQGDPFNAYLTTKAAIEMHTINLAAELAGSGVTANAFRPAAVDTSMQSFIREQPIELVGDAFHRRFLDRYANGELLSPDEPAQALLMLLESDRNGEIISTR